MKPNEQAKRSFSVLDLLILLLAAMLLTVGISLYARKEKSRRETETRSFFTSLSVPLEYPEYYGALQAGQKLFGEDGKEIGKILTATHEELSREETRVILECEFYGASPEQDEEFTVNTKALTAKARVLFAIAQKEGLS